LQEVSSAERASALLGAFIRGDLIEGVEKVHRDLCQGSTLEKIINCEVVLWIVHLLLTKYQLSLIVKLTRI